MPGLVDMIEEVAGSNVWVASAVRFTNTVGTALVSAVSNESGELIADIYTLTFTLVDPGVDALVHVATQSPNNPYKDPIGQTVSLDGVTIYKDVVPGLDLVFSNAGGFANTWTSQIRCGRYIDPLPAFGPGADVPGTARRHKVTNTGSSPAQACKAMLKTMVMLYVKVGEIFSRVRPFADDAVEKLTDDQVVPYAVLVSAVSGVGSSKLVSLLFDGSTVNVKNLTTNATSTSVNLNVVDWYRVTSGDLKDLEFMVSQLAVLSDEANVLVFGSRFIQIAPETAPNVAGTFGSADAVITEVGQSPGVITAGGSGFFWERPLVPDGGNSQSNPFPCNIVLSGQVSNAAGWAD